MQIVGIGRIIFWEGGSLWIGEATAPVAPHQHHAIQLTFGLRGRVRLRPAADENWTEHKVGAVPSDLPHAFEATGSLVAHIFVEPEGVIGRALSQNLGLSQIVSLPEALAGEMAAGLRAGFEGDWPDAEMVAIAQTIVASLAAGAAPRRITDIRVQTALAVIKSQLSRPMTLPGIAGSVHLSSSRFRHLFVAETGIAFKTYVLWLRLDRAIAAFSTGGSWTDAAHAASFADSAHLARTIRRMFGLAPSALSLMRADGPSRRSVASSKQQTDDHPA